MTETHIRPSSKRFASKFNINSGFDGARPLLAEISTDAFRANIARVEKLAPSSNVIVVIKADAYGHGLIEMAKQVEGHDLAVAVPSECQSLIEAQVRNRIWVLEGPFSLPCLKLSHRHDVVWVIHSLWQVLLIESFIASDNSEGNASEVDHSDPDGCINVVIKLDTGMHRLGFDKTEFEEALKRLRPLKRVNIVSLMTHFAQSDGLGNESVAQQVETFEGLQRQASLTHVKTSLGNSGAVLFYPLAHGDWVRPGIMLYGGMPSNTLDAKNYKLQAVMRLYSAIIAINRVGSGDTIGYGSTWKAKRESRIAVIACGYGDGYPRHAPNGTPVLYLGDSGQQQVPLVGRVSMDMLTIDVTDIPDAKIGDPVELWGENLSVDLVAQYAGTISYELFCNLSKRVPRYYY